MTRFQILTQEQIAAAREGGAILRACLDMVAATVREGMFTREINDAAEAFIRGKGAVPAFKGYHGFPATLCISINDECVHGIPGERRILSGDIVSIDCGVLFKELYTDACLTVIVGEVSPEVRRFVEVSERALEDACAVVRSGHTVGDISAAVQGRVEGAGYHCVRSLTGHGLGTQLHQFPDIPNVGIAGEGPMLPAFTMIAIEPITAMGTENIREKGDGWTICTADGSRSAHFEHTVLVLPETYEIIA